MQPDTQRTLIFQADANALGGFINQPLQKLIPSQASSSLSPVGGIAASRIGPFNFEEIVSFTGAYTRVTGREMQPNGPWSITATAVVEGLKLLEVITADRLVAQVSAEYPPDGGSPRIVVAGSTIDGLKIGGCDVTLALSKLVCGAKAPVSYPDFLQTGREQARELLAQMSDDEDCDRFAWLARRFGWMATIQDSEAGRCVLSSLVNGINGSVPGTTFGHFIEIPDIGRFFFQEALVCPNSIQISSFRAELGCGTSGKINGPSANVRGVGDPP
jgi:hypothetical protein